jgi:hypothetical protein
VQRVHPHETEPALLREIKMEKQVKFLEFFRVNRLLQYVVLAMVIPSIAFPAALSMGGVPPEDPRGAAALAGSEQVLTPQFLRAAVGITYSGSGSRSDSSPESTIASDSSQTNRGSPPEVATLAAPPAGGWLSSLGLSAQTPLSAKLPVAMPPRRTAEGVGIGLGTVAPLGEVSVSGQNPLLVVSRESRVAYHPQPQRTMSTMRRIGNAAPFMQHAPTAHKGRTVPTRAVHGQPSSDAPAATPGVVLNPLNLGAGVGAGEPMGQAKAEHEDETWGDDGAVTIAINPMRSVDPSPEEALAKRMEIRAKFPSVLKAIAIEAGNRGNTELARRLRLNAATLAADQEDQQRHNKELRDLDKVTMTPGLKAVANFMKEVFSQKVTRTRVIANWATVLVVCGLCYSLRGIIGYFNDSVNSVPNSSLSHYFQNEGADIGNKIVKATVIDLILLIPYYVYRMKVLVEYVAGQITMAPTTPKMQMSQKGILWAMGLGITYVATIGLSVLQGLGPANDTYQSNAPFYNTAEYARNAPVPLGIFMALNYFMVLIRPVEEKIIGKLVNLYSDPGTRALRTEDLETLIRIKKKVYGMRGRELRDLYATLQPQGGGSLKGLQLLKVLFQIVDRQNHKPQTSVSLGTTVTQVLASLIRGGTKGTRQDGAKAPQETPEILPGGGIEATDASHNTGQSFNRVDHPDRTNPVNQTPAPHKKASSPKDFKPILRSVGTGLFWLVAMAVAVASAFLGFKKASTGILNVDQRVKTGQPDLSFYEQTQIQRALRLEQQAWEVIPTLFSNSMAGWDVYNGLSDYTGNFSANNWRPYSQLNIYTTDACSKCYTCSEYGQSADGYYIKFKDCCPMTPPIPGGITFTFEINPQTALAYTSENCYGLFGYFEWLYTNLPYSLDPIPNRVLDESRYFYEWFLTNLNPPVSADPNRKAPYTPTPDMERFADTMGGLNAVASFGIGVFFFHKFFQYLRDSFAKDPTVPLPGKSNRLMNGIIMPLAAAQALFWSADGFFLTWGALNDSSLTLKILVGGAVVATRFTVWFRTFDEAFGAMAGLLKQGGRNVYGKYQKWRNPGHKRSPISEEDMVDRLIKRVSVVEEFYRKADPDILKEVRRVISPSAVPMAQ